MDIGFTITTIIGLILIALVMWSLFHLGSEASKIYKTLTRIENQSYDANTLEEVERLFEEAKNVGSFEKNTHAEKRRVISVIKARYKFIKKLEDKKEDTE